MEVETLPENVFMDELHEELEDDELIMQPDSDGEEVQKEQFVVAKQLQQMTRAGGTRPISGAGYKVKEMDAQVQTELENIMAGRGQLLNEAQANMKEGKVQINSVQHLVLLLMAWLPEELLKGQDPGKDDPSDFWDGFGKLMQSVDNAVFWDQGWIKALAYDWWERARRGAWKMMQSQESPQQSQSQSDNKTLI